MNFSIGRDALDDAEHRQAADGIGRHARRPAGNIATVALDQDEHAQGRCDKRQPFLAYITRNAWTFMLNSESTYDWETREWSVPVNFQVSKLVKFGKLPVSLMAGARYWTASPEDAGPEDWGAQLAVIFLLPK